MTTINWGARVITVPKVDTTLISGGPPEVRQLDVDVFRLALKNLEDDSAGMPFPDTHRHTPETVLGGVTYARFVEIVNGYTVTFEDGNYVVSLVGANNNIIEATNMNNVALRGNNAAGLIVSVQGSGVTQQDKVDIIDGVYAHADAGRVQQIDLDVVDDVALAATAGTEIADALLDRTDGAESGMTLRQWLRLGTGLLFSRTTGFGTTNPKFRDLGNTKDRISVIYDDSGNRTSVTLNPS